jgi:hypothetical protein
MLELQASIKDMELALKQKDDLIRQKDDDRKNEISKMKDFSERKLDDIRKCDSSVTEEKQRQWDKEKMFLETQLAFV